MNIGSWTGPWGRLSVAALAFVVCELCLAVTRLLEEHMTCGAFGDEIEG